MNNSDNHSLLLRSSATCHCPVKIAQWGAPWLECVALCWEKVFFCRTCVWERPLLHCTQTSLWKWKLPIRGSLMHTGRPALGSHICNPVGATQDWNLCSLALNWSSFSCALDWYHMVERKPQVGSDFWKGLWIQRWRA